MARMIPEVPREFDKKSREDEMFHALEQLPDEYTVVHSFKVLRVEGKNIHESETDFVVMHPDKGILFIEAKASVNGYRLERGEWYYMDGKTPMEYGGPMRQALRAMRNFENKAKELQIADLIENVRMEACIWLLSIDRRTLDGLDLPADIDKHLILTEESLLTIKDDIERLFEYKRLNETRKAKLNNKLIDLLLDKCIDPKYNLVASTGVTLTDQKLTFNRLLEEQTRLLDYLVDQPVGVINGAAGTGKTMLAVEMAHRYADQGERTLFLCYNRMLCEHLKQTRPHEHIDYFNIDAYAVKLTPSNTINYTELQSALMDMEDNFPYSHVIVDEGQDFGKALIEEAGLFDLFEMLVTGNEKKGTFFVFYDSNQLIQAGEMPAYIVNADCRLTLYRNSRNTHCIAETSMKPLPDTRRIKLSDKCLEGEPPLFMFAETAEKAQRCIDDMVSKLQQAGYTNIQLLTMTTAEKSIIAEYVNGDMYKSTCGQVPFTTCRRFKGLEADAIILIDVNKSVFEDEETKRVFYVGTSRARLALRVLSDLSMDECTELINQWGIPKTSKNAQKVIANYFRCNFRKAEE